jgi:signal transduction histidine kinase
VYIVSHDLKAPLISIQGYMAVLEADHAPALNNDAKFYLERMTANVLQLQSLISELTDLSRIGRTHDAWEIVDTRQMVQQVTDELYPQAQAKDVRIDIAEDLPVISCEAKRFRQVFANLIDNAIKYSDPAKDERWVRIDCEETDVAWRFSVRDNGIGIAGNHLEKAFSIFQRVGKSQEPGSGIGLSIVRRICEAHGGSAWAESAGEGKGTTFIFTIAKDHHKTS